MPAGLEEEEDTRPTPSLLRRPAFANPAPATYTVVKGDNLWRISCQQLRRGLDAKPTSAEIVPYWLQLIEINRDRLRSGDPDLIYPGEELLLP